MVEDLGCPHGFTEGLLKPIADNFKDGTKVDQPESSYSSSHASTPEVERGAQESEQYEKEDRKASFDLMKVSTKCKGSRNDGTQGSFYSSRHISTQNEEKGAETIVTKNEEKNREERKKEKS